MNKSIGATQSTSTTISIGECQDTMITNHRDLTSILASCDPKQQQNVVTPNNKPMDQQPELVDLHDNALMGDTRIFGYKYQSQLGTNVANMRVDNGGQGSEPIVHLHLNLLTYGIMRS